jgi:hypothetical protein
VPMLERFIATDRGFCPVPQASVMIQPVARAALLPRSSPSACR